MQLKEPPLVKPDANELHPDVNTGESIGCTLRKVARCSLLLLDPPPTFHNYLDDFLQAVRVFGFVS